MPEAHIIAARRTPQTKLLGSLSHFSAPQLGAHAIQAILSELNWNHSEIDQVVMGQVVSAGTGQAPARQAATLSGLPTSVGAVTVNKVCGSGLFAVMLADMAIRAGEYQRVIAGGMESMSQAPHLLASGRSGWKFGSAQLVDALEVDGLQCAASGQAMGKIAQQVSYAFKISRADQDAWAVRSHQLASAAQGAGKFTKELSPITVSSKNQADKAIIDEGPRADCALESLARLRPAFPLDESGDPFTATVTAGNASSLADGAAALAIVDSQLSANIKPEWAFRIVAHTTFAGPHQHLFTAPAYAIEQLLKKTGRTLESVDLIEINEAFAVQVLACMQILNLGPDRLNIHGGAIALGHPLGCSGARILVTLIHALLAGNHRSGIAALCLGGGEAVALLIDRV